MSDPDKNMFNVTLIAALALVIFSSGATWMIGA